MDSTAQINKTGDELDAQRFRIVSDIAQELSGETTFPTSFDLLLRLRQALQDPDRPIDEIATLVSMEPLIPLRLIRLANSAAHYPRGQQIKDVKHAVRLLGLNTVRSNAMAIAMEQMLRARQMASLGEVPKKLWEHSLRTACAARVIARRMTRLNPDEAMLAGLVHDLGAFYLLYRFAQYEELRIRPESAKHLAARWHESIGHALLIALGIADEIADAIQEHDTLRPLPAKPANLADVIYVANLLAGGVKAWLEDDPDTGPCDDAVRAAKEGYADLAEEIDTYEQETRAVLS